MQRFVLVIIQRLSRFKQKCSFFQHKGVPYCHVPCYGALFGPQLFGHGTRVESHKSFGNKASFNRPGQQNGPSLPRDHLESKLKVNICDYSVIFIKYCLIVYLKELYYNEFNIFNVYIHTYIRKSL